MGETVIKIEGLGKHYRLAGGQQERYLALRDVLAQLPRKVFSGLRKSGNSENAIEEFWALKDLSLEIKQGEVIGIIGRNGAGKSTLLKILSRITDPSEGRVKIRGRVASLLEVGTGFHPELTGRENIFLSGAILGMKRTEIKEQFDAIVDFAGIGDFLDTPVKKYSSGMQVRLGFAVAAHLSAEILLVDEILAVGDIEFQKKCLGKMNEVSRSGRTVLFVSHNLGSVQQLCSKAVVLHKGKTKYFGQVEEAIERYINQKEIVTNNDSSRFKNRAIQSVKLLNSKGEESSRFSARTGMRVQISFSADHPLKLPVIGINIKDKYNVALIGVNNRHYGESFSSFFNKCGVFDIYFEELPIISGQYYIDLFLGDINGDFERIEDVASFFIENNVGVTISPNLNLSINKVFVKNVSWKIK